MRRRLAAPLLVFAALLALVAVALVPRGLVRATAAQQLPTASVVDDTQIADPADDLHLPGVRAVVGKEEDDALPAPPASHALGASVAPAASPAPGIPDAPALEPGRPAGTDAGEPAPGRAPPQTV